MRIILLLSLTFNFLLASLLVYTKRDPIISRLRGSFSSPVEAKSPPIKEQLAAMNHAPAVYIDTSNNKPGKPFRLLVVGNSIALHGVANQIGWNHKSGMAATSMQKDYAHLLFNKVERVKGRLSMRVANIAGWERAFAAYDLKLIDSLVNYRPDVIVFQLGENVFFDSISTPGLFKAKYIALINRFKPYPLIVVTTPFFPSAEKTTLIKEVALETSSRLADLSHISLLDSTTLAKNEIGYKGNRNQWKGFGIGIHPGDKGMASIAEQIFIPINANITNRN